MILGQRRQKQTATLIVVAVLLTSATAWSDGAGRTETAVNTKWRFHFGDVSGAWAPGFDDSEWKPVTLPHTWNSIDGENGGEYRLGTGWYRTTMEIPPGHAGRRLYLQFDGANLVTNAWVNGQHAGHHEGGYQRFRLDITGLVVPGGTATVAVAVDNRDSPSVPPLSGDFTMHGGLYREVHLLATDPVHVDALDYGGPGLYVRQRSVSADSAALEVTTRVTNDTAKDRRVGVRTTVLDEDGASVATGAQEAAVAAGATAPVVQAVRVDRPRLWDGVNDPYLYTVTSQLTVDGQGGDTVSVPLGLRTVSVDADRGFLLNDRPYPLHGVNIHQPQRPGKGPAVAAADIDADFALIRELGANAVRMAHYQHPPRSYELADRLGLVAWTEVPLVNAVMATDAFTASARRQLRELIRQNYNHPSVVMWGLGNEQRASDTFTNRLLAELHAVARAEDPDRPTTYAHCCKADDDPLTSHASLSGYNRYYGWYEDGLDRLATWAEALHAADPDRRIGIAEYGGGASIIQHEQGGRRPDPPSVWHPEEWQALLHEHSWRAIQHRPFLWGSFVWVMFDFPSDARDEGDRPGANDKGLVTADRRNRKDAFYWYKANWSPAPVVHITSARDTPRFSGTADVKVYANTGPVRLRVNGADLGIRNPDGHIALWEGVTLTPGENTIEVAADHGGRPINDTAVWAYLPTRGAPAAAAVNAGSPEEHTAADGTIYAADGAASPSTAGETAAPVAGTDDQRLYQTYRSGTFSYRLPLANDTYTVTLKFAEPEWSRPAARIFHVNAERRRALTNVDIAATVGRYTAMDRTFTVKVTDGVLDLEFSPVVGEAVVSGIAVAAQT